MRRSISLVLFLIIIFGGYTYKAKASFDPSFIVEYNVLKDNEDHKYFKEKNDREMKANLYSSKTIASKIIGNFAFGYILLNISYVKNWFFNFLIRR